MFEKNAAPLLCTTVKGGDADEVIRRMHDLRAQGSDALLLRLEYLLPENRTEETLRMIFAAVPGCPTYATDYRKFDPYADESDERKAAFLLAAAEAGADLLDVPGNLFSDDVFELTYDSDAVARQRELIAAIHARGKKVLMSTHVDSYLPRREVLAIAEAQQARGADVLKIVTVSDTAAQLTDNLETTRLLHETMDSAVLFLSTGELCRFHRLLGPELGCCMWLATFEEGRKDQPLLSELKPLLDRLALRRGDR